MIIEKNTTSEKDELYEYPYYNARIQRRFISTKTRWFKGQYPLQISFEEEGPVERFQCLFRLVDLSHYAVYALATPTIQD